VEGWVVFGLGTSLRISVPPEALQERSDKSQTSGVWCPHLTFPLSGGRGDSATFVTHCCWEQPWKYKISHADSKLYSIKYI